MLLVVEKMKDAGLLPHASQAAMGPRVMRYRQPGDSSLQQKALSASHTQVPHWSREGTEPCSRVTASE